MELNTSQESPKKYPVNKDALSGSRLRPENEDFLDALMSVDMASTPERREVLEFIKNLN
jgi:hypothetical protein